ncbi:MAG: hypothetical protein AAB383_00535 [Patescibacteria group bacterium]
MDRSHIGPFSVGSSKEFLVGTPTQEYPEGYGLHLELESGADIRKLIRRYKSLLSQLTEEVGVLKITAASGDFNMREALKGVPLKTKTRRSLPLHVDLVGSVDPEEQQKYLYSTAFFPEYWSDGVQVFWQNATPRGRNASTVWVPSSVGADATLEVLTTPSSGLVESGLVKEEELELWNKMRELILKAIGLVGPSPAAQVMVLKDFFNLLFTLKLDSRRATMLNIYDRVIEHVLDQVKPWSLEMDWSTEEATQGLVCYSDAGKKGLEKKLLHTRRNRGKPMGRATVKGR